MAVRSNHLCRIQAPAWTIILARPYKMKGWAKEDDDGLYRKTWHNELNPEVYHLAAVFSKQQPRGAGVPAQVGCCWQLEVREALNTGSGHSPREARVGNVEETSKSKLDFESIQLHPPKHTNAHCLTTAGGRVHEGGFGRGTQRIIVIANHI